MSAKELLELSKREEWIALEVLARVLATQRRKLFRDIQRRGVPFTRIGREIKLTTQDALAAYYPQTVPVTGDHSGHSDR